MEYILSILGAALLGLVGYIFQQNKKIARLDHDVQTKDYEVKIEKEKRNLAMKRAAVEGAKLGAKQKVDEFYRKYGHLIKPDNESSDSGNE